MLNNLFIRGYSLSSLLKLLLVLLCLSSGFAAQARTARVLVLNSYPAGPQWNAEFDRGLRQATAQQSIWLFNRQMSPSANPDADYRMAQRELLKQILLYYQFDLVVSVGEQALAQLVALQDQQLLQVPVIAAGADLSAYMGASERLLSGIHEQLPLRENLLLIRQLVPDLEAIHLITDESPSGQQVRKRFIQLAKQFAISYTLWQGHNYEEVKAKTSQLSRNQVVLLGNMQLSRIGQKTLSEQAIASLSEASRAPLFSLWGGAIGQGAVGGFVSLPNTLGEAVGQMLNQVLQGSDIRDIPIAARGPQYYLFDSEQLARWKISPTNLPNNSILLNQRAYQTWFERYHSLLIVMAICLVLAIVAYIILLLNRRLKRHAVAQQKQLDRAFTFTEQACALLDGDGYVLLLNKAMKQLLGERAEYLLGNSLLDGHIWQCQGNLKQRLREAIDQALDGDAQRFQADFVQQGATRFYDFSLKPQTNPRAQLEGLVLELRDLSPLQQQQRQLKQSELHYRSLFDHSPAMLFLVNRLGVIVCCNQVAAEHLGYSRQQLNLAQLRTLYADEQQQLSLLSYLHGIGQVKRTRQVAYRSNQGKTLWFKESFVKMADDDLYMLVCEDITTTRSLAKELDFHANYDSLTGIYNRGFFERRLEYLLGEKQPNNLQHALLFIDLAQFKVINDTFGHASGDQALKQVAGVLNQMLPEQAIVARLGSDEFAILLENSSQQESLAFAAQVIEKLSDTHYAHDERMFSFGCSIGVTLFQQQQGSSQQVLAQADNACFTAKSLGRSRVYLYQMDDQMLLERQGQIEWVTRIQKALREERFLLYAQAIVPVSATDSDYLHYEVLIRMIDEDGRVVPPGAFLPAAENYNLADRIDRVVIAKSLQWLSENPGHLTRLNMCSMNLSGQSLGNTEFVEWLLNTLESSALPMNKLCFETTETVAIANLDVATQFFLKVRQLGCKIALDDFGSGLSSFGYLKQLPIDYLKIDGIFIRDLENDKMDAAIVKSINQMAQVMGKKTIAEFVENQAINQILAEIGVDYAQGYHFGKPVPIEMLVLK